MRKKISIIIPIYNGQKYIKKCIDALLHQHDFEKTDLEILLINDGSTDESLALLRTYAQDYPGIIVAIDQRNMGAAKTRNKGIDLASGEYVMFVDQDDYVEKDYCKKYYDAIEAAESDVVQGGFKTIDKKGDVVSERLPVRSEFGKFLAIPAWAKIYRTDFLRKNKITFFDNNIGEDNVFTARIIVNARQYGTIPYAGYCNLSDNEANVTNTLHKGLSETVKFVELLNELAKIQSDNNILNEMLQYNVIRTSIYYLLSYGRHATPVRFLDVYSQIFQWIKTNMPKLHKNRYLWVKPKGEYVAASVGIISFLILHKAGMVRIFTRIYCKGITR